MQKFKVAIARFPANGWEHTACVEWLIKTVVEMKKDERISDVLSIKPGGATPITMLRNKAVVDAKASGADYLLMVDSDMHPDLPYPGAKPFWKTAWEFMLARRQKEWDEHCAGIEDRSGKWIDWLVKNHPPATIAAPYCGPPPSEYVYVFNWTSQMTGEPNPDFCMNMVPREMAAIASGIQEVAALPTGLILYDMRVFDILPPPWFKYEFVDETESEKATTEDVYQTRNASLLKLPQFVAWDCFAGHIKAKTVLRPVIVTRDSVHRSLVEAVSRGVDRGDSLIIMDEPPKANGDPMGRLAQCSKIASPDFVEAIADDDRI